MFWELLDAGWLASASCSRCAPLLLESCHDISNRCVERCCDVTKFDYVEATLTGLVLTDERLRNIEAFGNLHLG